MDIYEIAGWTTKVDREKLQELAQRGSIERDTPIRKVGEDRFTMASQIDGLFPKPMPKRAVDQCPKCDGEMVRGYVPDVGYACVFPLRWFDGPEKIGRTFLGLTVNPDGIEARSGGVPVAAFRCDRCGYLEWFARTEFEPE